jgi:hypothetical protein
MKHGWSPIVVGVALAAALGALPRPALASRGAATKGHEVVLKPLFDTNKRFKPKKTVLLRFRVQDKATGVSLGLEKVSFSLLHPPRDPDVPLAARKLKNGVFVVPFTPTGPGRYAILAAVRGASLGSIRPVQIGVVGVADGLTELPPSADAEVRQRGKGPMRSARRR